MVILRFFGHWANPLDIDQVTKKGYFTSNVPDWHKVGSYTSQEQT